MNELKYIIFRIGSPYMYYYKACVFSGMLVHSAIAEVHSKEKAYEVCSAGFCRISVSGFKPMVFCYGESKSLKVGSNPDFDANVIIETLF